MGLLVADHSGRLASRLERLRPAVVRTDTGGAIAAVRAGAADAAVVHGDLPPEGGVAAALRLAAQGAAVVVATAATEPAALAAGLRAGARAVVGLDADANLLELALAAARDGRLFVASPAAPAVGVLLAAADDPFPQLSRREREVLAQLATGAVPGRLASRLGLAPKTVRHHVGAIVTKLDVADATAAGRLARRAGIGFG